MEVEAGRDGRERAPFARILTAIGGIYVAQSIVTGIALMGLPAIMRQAGMPLDQIGLVYLILLPWVLKGLWSGAIERYRLPETGRPRTPRIVAVGTIMSALALAIAAGVGVSSFLPLLGLLMLAALATATVDIACDGFAVEALSERNRGWGNTAQVGGSYLGLSIGSALFIYLAAESGWTAAMLAMAALVLGLGIPFAIFAPALGSTRERLERPTLARAFQNPRIRKGLLLVLVFDLAQRLGQGMLGPFLIDAGVSLKAVGVINGLGGAGIGILGTVAGGAVVRRFGAPGSLRFAIAVQALCLAMLAASAAMQVKEPSLLALVALLQAGAAAFGFVALYAELMGYASPNQAGIDFTLFQCADALLALLGGTAGGVLAGRLGYAGFFALASGLAFAAVAAVALVRSSQRSGDMECGATTDALH